MVIEAFRDILAQFMVIFAAIAAITGIIVLNLLFHNKLKDLFDDKKYFIIFALVGGYLLYAVGEVSFYLMEVLAQDDSAIGIADLYWGGGAILVVLAFFAVFVNLFRAVKDSTNFLMIGGVGIVLVGGVLYYLLGIIQPGEAEISVFNYFYPIIGAVIITFASSAVLFSKELGSFGSPLITFFFASLAIFIGDLLFINAIAEGTYLTSAIGGITDIAYCIGYGLSAVGFFQMYKHIRNPAKAK